MKWVPLSSKFRKTTMQERAHRRVAMLTPIVSPKLRKRGRSSYSQSNGCKCALGSPCKRLRLQNTALPPCDPRLAKFPGPLGKDKHGKDKKVIIPTWLVTIPPSYLPLTLPRLYIYSMHVLTELTVCTNYTDYITCADCIRPHVK